jgi:hypothetical protein
VPVRPRRTTRIALAGSLVAAGLLFVTAQAAGASWRQLGTPNVSGASAWEFSSVSCTSPTICMAVGESFGSADLLLSETRTKKLGWIIQPIPEPALGSALLSVWCTFANACTAVGDEPIGLNGSVPLAERWNGSKWSIQKTPAPAGAPNSVLDAVTCASAFDCVAVGSASPSVNSQVPLVEHWNGSTWKIEKAPTRRPGFTESQLSGVSCTSATRCFAVGSSFNPSPLKFVTLAEVWNGSRWTIQATPNATSRGSLNGVSCLSRNDCLAVGDGFGARWNGKKWSLVKLGVPGGPANLTSISCRAGVCYADGGFFQDAVLQGVIEFWNGSRWRVQNATINTSFDSSVYNGISCRTAVNCTAVGSYHDPTTGNRALAQDFSLRWQDVSPTPFSGVTGTELSAVSCVSPNSCVAVGTFFTASPANESFSDAWDGSLWTSANMPKQASTSLDAVSCKTRSFCIAVGDRSISGHNVTLAERWNGITWVIQKTPSPAGALGSFLVSVSCPTTKACTAAGFYVTHSGGLALLAEQWNGKSWARTRTPRLVHRSGIEFRAVSCASAKACEAVASSSTGPFAERWNGTSWKAQATPLQKGGRDGFLAGVSCVAHSCIAVGDDLHGGKQVPIDERWNGKSWKPQQAAVPAHVSTSGLKAVSCVSASVCEAVGFAISNVIAEHWNGRRWSMQNISQPPGAQGTELPSLSCTTPTSCIGVGLYSDSTAMEQILAEQFS